MLWGNCMNSARLIICDHAFYTVCKYHKYTNKTLKSLGCTYEEHRLKQLVKISHLIQTYCDNIASYTNILR